MDLLSICISYSHAFETDAIINFCVFRVIRNSIVLIPHFNRPRVVRSTNEAKELVTRVPYICTGTFLMDLTTFYVPTCNVYDVDCLQTARDCPNKILTCPSVTCFLMLTSIR